MTPVIETTSGKVRGVREADQLIFRSIPYAAPPVGPLRWKPPAPTEPWAGEREATQPPPFAPQNPSPIDQMMGRTESRQSEDCLYLNVWTPAADGRRPVMVWIHGGAFAMGGSAQTLYDGAHLARRDVVVVTIGYRLGALGFLRLAEATGGVVDATGSEGLLDQQAALRWVRDNIERFGGDPENVTIFGESAGGMSVGCHLAAPESRGLFQKAIAQSGACHTVRTIDKATYVAEGFLRALGRDASGLGDASPGEILAAQAKLAAGRVDGFPGHQLGMTFQPCVDGRVLERRPIDAVRSGAAASVPVMTGTTRDEWRLFAALDQRILGMDEARMRRRLGYLLGEAPIDTLVETYREELVARDIEATPGEILTAIQTDRAFGLPALRLLDALADRAQPGHGYLFDWQSPLAGGALRSPHAVELGFVFGTFGLDGARRFFGEGDAARALSDATMQAWTRFAREGDPGWERYTKPARRTQVLGASPRMAAFPPEAVVRAWSSVDDEVLGSL